MTGLKAYQDSFETYLNETVSVGTAVGYDVHSSNAITLTCFEGIHYDPDTTTY